jgi:hypothetical protein
MPRIRYDGNCACIIKGEVRTAIAILGHSIIFMFVIFNGYCFRRPYFLIKHFGNNYSFWVGIFSIATFIFSFMAGLLDWKVLAERHKYAFETYMNLKFTAGDLINKIEKDEHADVERFLEKYYALTPTIISIPERAFLQCKRKHVIKVFISKYLDECPAVSITLLKIKIWVRDNFKAVK